MGKFRQGEKKTNTKEDMIQVNMHIPEKRLVCRIEAEMEGPAEILHHFPLFYGFDKQYFHYKHQRKYICILCVYIYIFTTFTDLFDSGFWNKAGFSVHIHRVLFFSKRRTGYTRPDSVSLRTTGCLSWAGPGRILESYLFLYFPRKRRIYIWSKELAERIWPKFINHHLKGSR